jgi:hypothetical protein
MNGPSRLLESSSHAGVRELLRAGIDESPRPAALQRTALALGVSGSIVSATAAASATGAAVVTSAAAPTTLALAAKWIAIGTLCGGGLAASAQAVSDFAATPPPAAAVTNRLVGTPAAQVASAIVVTHAGPAEPAAPQIIEAQPPGPARSTPTRTSTSTPSPALPASASLPDAQSLAHEVTTIDAARAALSAGRAANALAQVDGYFARARTGTLDREAELLRIDALTALGQRDAAAAHARAYAANYPRDPRLGRLRALLSEP